MCVYVCVWEGERERRITKGEKEKDIERWGDGYAICRGFIDRNWRVGEKSRAYHSTVSCLRRIVLHA